MENWVGYLIIIIYLAITFRIIMMGLDKMAKVIIGNYVSGITCFAFGNIINWWIQELLLSPNKEFIGISYSNIAKVLSAGQLTLILIMFALFTWIIYKYGKHKIEFNIKPSTEKLYFIIMIPITLLSFIIGPNIALHAEGITVLNFLEQSLGNSLPILYNLIHNIDIWTFVNGLVFIIISSQINLKFSFSSKATKLPEGFND